MCSERTFVVVGAGQAGGCAVESMRAQEFDGRIVLIGEENYPPYERPPLSKELLAGDLGPERTFLKNETFYREREIELRLGARVTAIECSEQRIRLSDGDTIGYDKLLLTTGSRVRKPSIPGADLAGTFYLRDIDDSLAIRSRLNPDARLVIVGGGYIGLEVAAAARRRGCHVTVLELQDVVMGRVVAPEISRFYAEVHREHGVDIRTGAEVLRIEGGDRVERVVCADGLIVPADLVVIGVGILPNSELAEDAGLAVDNGVVVDEYGQTSDPQIFAAGDLANHPNPILGRRLRLESWQNAQNQAISTAKAMCGNGVPYAEVPWFWSDQYDLNLQMLGVAEHWDRLVFRGSVEERKFSVFYLLDGIIVAANAINSARDVAPARKMIAERRPVEAEVLASPDIPLKRLLKA